MAHKAFNIYVTVPLQIRLAGPCVLIACLIKVPTNSLFCAIIIFIMKKINKLQIKVDYRDICLC